MSDRPAYHRVPGREDPPTNHDPPPMNPPLGHRSSDHVGSVRLLEALGAPPRRDDGEPEKGASILSSSGAGGTNRNAEPAILWGIPLRFADERRLAYFLGGGAVACYLAFTATQEGVFASMGGAHGGMVTLVTTAVYCCLAFGERVRSGETHRKGTWRDYLILAAMTSGGMYATNAALAYLNYTTRIVAKSSKVIPTMLLGTVMQGRRYSASEYLAAGMLVLGIALFTMGDVDTLPSFEVKGIVLIAVALCLDSAAGNFEERRFFNVPDPVHHAEVVYHANLIGMGLTCVGMWLSGELWVSVAFVASNVTSTPLMAVAAAFGYLSVSFILLLIRHYGAANTEVVKSMRKMVSIALSMTLYPKPWDWKYGAGAASTVVGLYALYAIKRRKYLAAGPGGNMEAAK